MQLVLLLVLGLSLARPARADDAPDFDRQVAPLLARHCLDCHSGPDPKGDLDLSRRASTLGRPAEESVITPGEPDDSLLLAMVEDGSMPPKEKLADAEVATLRAWIVAGAPWGTDPIDPYAATSDRRAGRDWWALAPLNPPALPGGGHPVDALILPRLTAAGLRPAPPAEPRTLIRRVAFDLTGLPPTPEEVDAFLADPHPDAYGRMVDRYLASPQYGVRWARAWLDLARFGESNGFEHDEFRPDAWRYRDWVVSALNDDLPYDEFARLQLAGDLLRPDDPSAVEATGFLVAGSYDSVGQGQISEVMRKVVRQDELEDLVGTVGQAFLGLTVNCARCHDHKFDPITQADYYRLAAALDGVRHGVRDLSAIDPENLASRRHLESLRARLAALEAPARARFAGPAAATGGLPLPVARWEFTRGSPDDSAGLRGDLLGGARLDTAGLRLDGSAAHLATAPLPFDLRAKTLEAWVRLDNLEQRGGAVLGVQDLDGSGFDAIVFGEREPGRWMAGSEGFARSDSFLGPPEVEADARLVQIVVVYDADGTITAYRDGQPYGQPTRPRGPRSFAAGRSQVLVGLRHSPAGGNRMLAGLVARAAVYDRALRPEEVAATARFGAPIDPEALAAALTPEHRAERARLLAKIDVASSRSTAPRKAYAVSPGEAAVTHLLVRGNASHPAEAIAPEPLSALVPPVGSLGLPPDAPDRDRRTRLAAWISSPENPLFARVIVNRVWLAHFGAGLVETPSDFGFNGGQPSHPELLDWLAADLIAHGYSLKHLHRRTLTSAAYQRSSRIDPEAEKADAGNRLLWRKSPRRLEAEMTRDAMLAAAGLLDPALGGPGYRDFRIVRAEGTITTQYLPPDPSDPTPVRRTLYRTWARGGRSGFLDALDCPDPSTTAPLRNVTNTPLQALALLNNAMVLDLSDRMADRLAREAGPDPAEQVALAYQLAFARPASVAEIDRAGRVAAKHGMGAVCRAILNSNEFLFLD